MPVDPLEPNLSVTLALDADAPRAARYHVSHVDSPSPDLRDAVVLLTSELVTRAVTMSPPAGGGQMELRVWMPPDVVRVEVRSPRTLFGREPLLEREELDRLLYGRVADRWSVGAALAERQSMWFEIDRHAAPAGVESLV